mgnify:CR=1 FL=1
MQMEIWFFQKKKETIQTEFTLLKKREIVNQILKEENCNAILRSIVDNIQDHGYYDQDKLEDVESLTMEGLIQEKLQWLSELHMGYTKEFRNWM